MVATAIKWKVRGEMDTGYYSSACGRFDLFRSEFNGRWVALDADTGRIFRADDRPTAETWCEVQLEGT